MSIQKYAPNPKRLIRDKAINLWKRPSGSQSHEIPHPLPSPSSINLSVSLLSSSFSDGKKCNYELEYHITNENSIIRKNFFKVTKIKNTLKFLSSKIWYRGKLRWGNKPSWSNISRGWWLRWLLLVTYSFSWSIHRWVKISRWSPRNLIKTITFDSRTTWYQPFSSNLSNSLWHWD